MRPRGQPCRLTFSFLILIATTVATLAGIIITALWQKINLFQPLLLLTSGGLIASVGVIVWGLGQMDKDTMALVTNVTANVILLGIIVTFIAMGAFKKINVYDAFIEGAKDGFHTAVRIIPYLVAILVAVAVFRASGAMDMLVEGIALVCQSLRSGRPICRCAPHSLHEAA